MQIWIPAFAGMTTAGLALCESALDGAYPIGLTKPKSEFPEKEMQNRMKIVLAAATFAALGLVAAGGGGMFTAAAQTDSFSEGQVNSIEKIV